MVKKKLNEKLKKPGVFVDNKTKEYLSHCLKIWGNKFYASIIKNTIIAYGVADFFYSPKIYGDRIFVLVDTYGSINFGNYSNIQGSRIRYEQDMEYISNHIGYITDYAFNNSENLRMLVLRIPQHYVDNNIIDKFVKGDYSKMFSQEDIETIIQKYYHFNKTKVYTKIYQVLTKNEPYAYIFQNKLMKDFNLREKDIKFNIKDREWDYSPILSEEIFNYE